MRAAESIQARTRVGRAIARARKPNRDHMEALKKHMPFWFVFVTLLFFAGWQILLNPFGFSSVIQRYTQDISDLLITGPFYPTSGHNQISVALTEEDTLQALNEPWPWSYGAHARLLDALLAYKPRAVIVDYLFVDNRNDDTLADLVTEIGRYKAAHVPIFFEGGRDVPFGEAPLRPEIAATGVPILDPSILVNNGVVRQYPTTGECFRLHRASRQCMSLALSIYRNLAKRDPKMAPLQVNTAGLMELVWGTNADPFNRKWRTVTGEDGQTLSCDDKMGFFSRIFAAFFDAESVRQRCPYSTIIPVEELVKGTADPDFPKIIPGRVIFYGASLEGAQDKSFTPVSGLQANVFVHAMALDNLLTYGGKPEQNVVTFLGRTYESDPVQLAAIVPVILILTWLHMRRRARAQAKQHKDLSATLEYFLDKGLEMAWHWLAFFLALGAGLALTLAVGLSVANWVEVVFVSVELAAMLLIGVPDALWGYLHHVAGGVPDLQET